MSQLKDNESGVARALIIAAFVVVFVGLAAFAYTRVSDDGPVEINGLEQPVEDDDAQLSGQGDDPIDPSEDEQAIELEAATEEAPAE